MFKTILGSDQVNSSINTKINKQSHVNFWFNRKIMKLSHIYLVVHIHYSFVVESAGCFITKGVV